MSLYKDNQLKIYNSLSGEKEIFNSITPGYIGMYVCGPTVYSNVHLGNVRTFMSFDVIYRYLKHLGFKVRYVRNITDAGHLESDSYQGEDRFSKKARIEEIEPMEIVQRYTTDFHYILQKFNFLSPSIEPTATGHMIEQIEIIKDILKKDLAYIANGSVYFDVHKYNETKQYGVLSNRNLEDLINNSRELEGQTDKKNPQDFALWKKAEPQHIMRWPSPWGDGFPGWHLECTAMSTKYLGNEFDIHGGGMDLKFPHHECEIAQAQASTNKAPVRFWMHTNMLIMNGKKMSKSTGNYILPHEIMTGENPHITKAFSANVARFFMLQAHYRSILDFTNDGLLAAEKGLNRLLEAYHLLNKIEPHSETTLSIASWKKGCYNAMNDDFNTSILIAQLFEASKIVHQLKNNTEKISKEDLIDFKSTISLFLFDVLGLTRQTDANSISQNNTLNGAIELLIELRNHARVERNYPLSDRIRDELASLGVQLKDDADGTHFTLN